MRKNKEEKQMTTATNEIKFQQEGELAIVRVLENGRIEVERDGKATKFQPHHTIEDVTEKFTVSGWSKVEEPKKVAEVTEDVQQAADLYLELHAKEKELKAQMEKLKSKIKPFMEEHDLDTINGTQGKQICLIPSTASNSTNLYSNYDPAEISLLLPQEYYNDVVEARVNSEKLEALLKLDKLTATTKDAIKAAKIVKQGTPQFRVKK